MAAVRVSRAGLTQHYPHADFIRSYRGLGKLELMSNVSNRNVGNSPLWAKSSSSSPSSPAATPKSSSYSGRKWGTPGRNGSHGGFTTPNTPRSSNGGFTTSTIRLNGFTPETKATESNPQNPKQQCLELLKVIYKKLVDYEKEPFKENVPASEQQQQQPSSVLTAAAPVKSKSYSYSSSTPPPSCKASSRGGFSPTTKTAPVGKLKTNHPSRTTNQHNNKWERISSNAATSTTTTTSSPASTPTTTTASYHRGG